MLRGELRAHRVHSTLWGSLALSTHCLHEALQVKDSSFSVIRSSNLVNPVATKREDWRARVKGLLKSELKRRNLSYADLAAKLAAIGIKDNERNISNKIGRGSFTAVFFLQCMEAIECKTIHLEDH